MRENLLKNQPTWGLRRAQGTGQKSATPATLTKVILVLLTMFLLPSAAWGQITVAGNSPDQSGNITGTGITGGTVTYSNGTLTLTDAEITGDIVWNPSGNTDLTIYLSGTNTLNGAISTDENISSTVETNLSFTGSTDCSLEITKESESVISGNFKTVNFGNFNLATSSPGAYWDENENRMADYSGGAATNLKITSEVYYPIWVHDYNSSTGYLQLTHDVPSITYDGRNADHTNDKGTISFDKDHNTITLDAITYAQGTDNAVIVVGPSMSELTVDLVDESSVSDPDPVLYFTGSTNLTFTTSSSGASLSANSLYAWKNNAGSVTYNNGLVENNGTISYQAPPITVAGVSPDSEGKFSGISGVTFTPANAENKTPATLTLNGATITSIDGIVWTGEGNLTIQFSGNNIINSHFGGEATGNVGICITGNSTSTLTITAANDASTLTLKPNYEPSGNDNNKNAIRGFTSVSLNEGWGMYYTDNCSTVTDATSPTAGKEVIICKGQPLGLSVGGVVVTNKNQGDILGDGKVSFTSATTVVDNPGASTPATLTLNGATISGNIQSSISPLTVYLKGSSTIKLSNASDAPFQYTGTAANGSLTFKSSEADDGELTLGGAFSKEEKGETGEKYFQFSSGNYTYSNQICEWYSSTTYQYSRHTYTYWGVKDENKIFYNAHYGITINDYEVTKFNKENVTGDNYDFAYFPDDNYLIVPDNISHTSSFEIKSHRAELNIRISGDCAVKAIKFDDSKTDEFGTPETRVLNIDRSSSSTPGKNTLTIDTESSEPAISGFTSVNISENLHFDVPETAPSAEASYPSNVVISDIEFYDLWVGYAHVSSQNAGDIFESKMDNPDANATASFDKTTNTLTLEGAQISAEGEECGIESKLGELTVNIIGTNTITCYGENAVAIKGTGSNSILFTGEATSEIDITALNPISDITATYENGLGLTTVSGQAHFIEHLKTPGISSSSSEDGISVTLTRPYEDGNTDLNTKYENAKMYYSITYASETNNIGVTEYTEPFTMTKPGTVTAYLIPGEGRGQSDNETGKYYGYPDAPYTMAVGDELTPEIYPAIEENDYIGLNGSASADESIATFTYTDGVVKALAAGTVTLTAILTGSDMSFTVLNPKESSEPSNYNYPVTFSVVVGENLNTMFAEGQNFGTYYNTSTTTYAVPEGMKAYVITGADPETGKVTTAETTVLPPNTPVLLEKGSAKAFTYIPATSGTAPSGNILLYTGNTDVQATEGSNLYVLYNDKFVKVTTGTRILSQKCYLKLNTSSSGTRSYYDIDGSDGTTGIREVKSEGVKGEKWNDGEWYTLQGQRVTKPTKPGLYILNGKKVVIK